MLERKIINPCHDQSCTKCCKNISMHNITWGEIKHILNYNQDNFYITTYELWNKLNWAFYGNIPTIIKTINEQYEESNNKHLIFLYGDITKIQDDTKTILLLNGSCPLLDEHGLCADYDKRPSPCRNFKFQGVDCLELNINIDKNI